MGREIRYPSCGGVAAYGNWTVPSLRRTDAGRDCELNGGSKNCRKDSFWTQLRICGGGRYCKKKIWQFFQREQSERRRDNRTMENRYYEFIYDVLQQSGLNDTTLPALNRLTAIILRLHSVRLQTNLMHKNDADRIGGEQPTLYNILQMQRRRTDLTIRCLRNKHGHIQTTPSGIAHTQFTSGKCTA